MSNSPAPITLTGQAYSAAATYNPDRPGLQADGMACFELNEQDGPLLAQNCTFDGGSLTWGFKASLYYNATFAGCTFIDGTERAFDEVRGGRLTLTDCKFVNTGKVRTPTKSRWTLSEKCDLGVKGGVRDVTLTRCSIHDILLGDYSIYDQVARPKTRRITLVDCVNPNGGPIIIRGRWCDGTTLVVKNTAVSTLVWPSWVTSLYFAYNRKFGDTRVITANEFEIFPQELV